MPLGYSLTQSPGNERFHRLSLKARWNARHEKTGSGRDNKNPSPRASFAITVVGHSACHLPTRSERRITLPPRLGHDIETILPLPCEITKYSRVLSSVSSSPRFTNFPLSIMKEKSPATDFVRVTSRDLLSFGASSRRGTKRNEG